MKNWSEFISAVLALILAGIPPLIFPVSAAGYFSMHSLSEKAMIPAMTALIILWIFAILKGWSQLTTGLLIGSCAGIAGTLGLEIVRETGFRVFHSMPGELPMLMGALLTNRMMVGPDLLSNLIGWGYHFLNGACFGIIYLLIFGKRPWWNGMIYGFLLAVGFMTSPVVVSMGAGIFGRDIGPSFAITVITAHLVFGGILGWVVSRFSVQQTGVLHFFLSIICKTNP